MLKLTIPQQELFNHETGEFSTTKEIKLVLEHSLVSLSKWESKWEKPFLADDIKTDEETMYYIKCMTLTQNVKDDVYQGLKKEHFDAINKYIEADMTATTFSDQSKKKGPREVITSELIYYWMVALNIDIKCEKWHLNRLLTLVNVCNIKNQPAKKIGKKEQYQRNRSLNEARKAKMNTKG